jgi:hypothetical protein
VVTEIVNGRTATLLAAMNLLTFTLLATVALTGHLAIRWRDAIAVGIATLVITGAALLGMRWYFSAAVENAFDKEQIINEMESPIFPEIHKVYWEVPAVPREDPGKTLLERILERGVLRVGYTVQPACPSPISTMRAGWLASTWTWRRCWPSTWV